MSISETIPTAPLDMEGAGIPEAHVRGIDMDHRAADLTPAQQAALPEPILPNHPDWVALYWRAWAIAFDKVRHPAPETGLVTFVDEGFSDNMFQWDTSFMLAFLRYAAHVLPVTNTLDNFYAKQHPDGFICREISEITGEDFWPKDHLSAINPPLFADAEWRLYLLTGDVDRLRRVFPALLRYYQWLQQHRRHGDGTGYWTTSLASGMDNTPRAFEQGGTDVHLDYGYVWLCMTAQQLLNARHLGAIADLIDAPALAQQLQSDAKTLAAYLNTRLWHDDLGLYVDGTPDGGLATVKTPAMMWPALAGACPPDRAARLAAHVFDATSFWRPHAMPSLSADHVVYHPRGNYWQGSVWPPLVYLTIEGLRATQRHDDAYRVTANHLDQLSEVFEATSTLWENYAPEAPQPGNIAKPEFVGWTGCGPIAALIETILGIDVDAPSRTVTWRLTQPGDQGIRNLHVAGQPLSLLAEPTPNGWALTAETTQPLTLRVYHDGHDHIWEVPAGSSRFTF